MTTARAVPVSWEIYCSVCRDLIPAPKGSEFWTGDDFSGKATVTCGFCGAPSKLPAAVRDKKVSP